MDQILLVIRYYYALSILLLFAIQKPQFLNSASGPVAFLILYAIACTLLFFSEKKKWLSHAFFIVLDLLLNAWAVYCFNSDYFLLFFFLILACFSYHKPFKEALGMALAALGLVYAALIVKTSPRTLGDLARFLLYLTVPLAALYSGAVLRRGEKKRTEELAELGNQNKIKNEILSTLSHELRTPLTMIKTSADILSEERPGRVNETQKNFLEIISSNVSRLMHLVEDILSRIKIETTWLKLDLRPVDVRSLFKGTIVSMKPVVEKKNQVLKFAYPKLLSKAMADKNWIQQVLINLIQNSSKNLGEQGTIAVSLRENEQYVLVSVSDNGCGIEPDRAIGLFSGEEPENARDFGSIGNGFGFGLSIVKHVVEKHHGKLYVGSVEGLGTTISFTLPKKEGGSF